MAVQAVLLVVFSAVLIAVILERESRQLENLLTLSAVELNAVVDVRGGEYFVLPEDTVDLRTRGVMAWVVDNDENPVLIIGTGEGSGLPQPIPELGQIGRSRLQDGTPVYAMNAPFLEGSRRLGTIILALPQTESRRFVSHLLLAFGISVPLVLVVSAAAGLFLASRTLSPIARIAETARKISNADDLSHRLEVESRDNEIRDLVGTFNEMLDRLKQSFQRERQFTADVSHELRTPLSLLKVQMSLARSRSRDTKSLRKIVADMEDDVDRMTHLIEQMLSLARIDQHSPVPLERVSLRTIVRDVLREFEPSEQSHKIVLTEDAATMGEPFVLGNAERLRQVVRNLIENALKYTESDGTVRISVHATEALSTLTVRDNGIGVPREALPLLQERFYRVGKDRSRQSGGFGLGLAIVHAIVLAHHGQMSVESELGKGTEFVLHFPAVP